jgi:hypothetical protein
VTVQAERDAVSDWPARRSGLRQPGGIQTGGTLHVDQRAIRLHQVTDPKFPRLVGPVETPGGVREKVRKGHLHAEDVSVGIACKGHRAAKSGEEGARVAS